MALPFDFAFDRPAIRIETAVSRSDLPTILGVEDWEIGELTRKRSGKDKLAKLPLYIPYLRSGGKGTSQTYIFPDLLYMLVLIEMKRHGIDRSIGRYLCQFVSAEYQITPRSYFFERHFDHKSEGPSFSLKLQFGNHWKAVLSLEILASEQVGPSTRWRTHVLKAMELHMVGGGYRIQQVLLGSGEVSKAVADLPIRLSIDLHPFHKRILEGLKKASV